LVQQVMTIFQPVIRQYADQWYHFVEVWPYQSFKEQLP
jgi:hypothetical protein